MLGPLHVSLLTDDQCRVCFHGPHAIPCTEIAHDPGPDGDVASVCGCIEYVDLERESQIMVRVSDPVGSIRTEHERMVNDDGVEVCTGGGLWPCHAAILLEQLDAKQATFDLRWKADMRAIDRWQKAHPGNDLVWPDHADMVVWLLDELDRWSTWAYHLYWERLMIAQGGPDGSDHDEAVMQDAEVASGAISKHLDERYPDPA